MAKTFAEALLEKYDASEPRDEDGRWTDGGGMSAAVSHSTWKKYINAVNSYKCSTAEKQQRGEGEQARLAKVLGIKDTGDNNPFDLLNKKHGIEVKTVMDNDNDKITVHPESRRRKEAFAKAHKVKMHTVAIDVRGNKRVYYYKAGVGAYRLSSMTPMTPAALRRLLK